jgi:hypothetical protein
MKEVRLNDKMWFGKYKGTRINDIIRTDATFIQKLVKEGKIKLDEKCQYLFDTKYGTPEKKLRYGFTSSGTSRYGGFAGEPAPGQVIGIGADVNGREYVIGENPPENNEVAFRRETTTIPMDGPSTRDSKMVLKTVIPSRLGVNVFSILKDNLVKIFVKAQIPLEHFDFVVPRLARSIESNPLPYETGKNYEYETIVNVIDMKTGRIKSSTLVLNVYDNGILISHYELK